MNLKQYLNHLPADEKRFSIITFLLISALTIINIFRAIYIPTGFDESATFFHYVQSGRVFPFVSDWDANNHYLNSLLTWISYTFFGDSSLSLRMANVLAFPAFLWFIFRISLRIKNLVTRSFLIASLFFSLHFIDFFSVSRGYGLSIGLLTIALYYCTKIVEEPAKKFDINVLAFTFLAVYANLTLITTYLLILAFLFIIAGFNRKTIPVKMLLQKVSVYIIFGILPLAGLTFLLLMLKKQGALYYGLPAGFIDTTLGSFTFMLTGIHSVFLAWLVIFYAIIIGSITAYRLTTNWKTSIKLFKPALIFNTLFILNLIAPLVLKFVLGINYPQDRTILYLFVFLICSLGFTIDWLTEIYPLRKQYFILLVLPFLYFPVHFFTHVNFTHTFHYSDDYLPTRFFEKIIKNSDSDGYPSMVGGYKSRLLVWSMYNYRSGGEQCQISWENYPGILEDYQIVDPKIYPEWTTYYDSIDYDHIGGRILYKRKEKPQVTLYQRFAPINMDTMSTRKFYILFNQPIDTMEGRAFRFDFDFTLYVPLRPFRAWVVVSVTDDKGQDLKYQYMPLQWNKPYWSGEPHNLKNRMIIPSLPKGSKFIKAYIWNLDKQAFKLNSSVCSLYTFNPEELPEALK